MESCIFVSLKLILFEVFHRSFIFREKLPRLANTAQCNTVQEKVNELFSNS